MMTRLIVILVLVLIEVGFSSSSLQDLREEAGFSLGVDVENGFALHRVEFGGTVVAVWVDGDAVKLQRYDIHGEGKGDEIKVTSSKNATILAPKVVEASHQSLMIVWTESIGGGLFKPFARFYVPTSNSLGVKIDVGGAIGVTHHPYQIQLLPFFGSQNGAAVLWSGASSVWLNRIPPKLFLQRFEGDLFGLSFTSEVPELVYAGSPAVSGMSPDATFSVARNDETRRSAVTWTALDAAVLTVIFNKNFEPIAHLTEPPPPPTQNEIPNPPLVLLLDNGGIIVSSTPHLVGYSEQYIKLNDFVHSETEGRRTLHGVGLVASEDNSWLWVTMQEDLHLNVFLHFRRLAVEETNIVETESISFELPRTTHGGTLFSSSNGMIGVWYYLEEGVEVAFFAKQGDSVFASTRVSKLVLFVVIGAVLMIAVGVLGCGLAKCAAKFGRDEVATEEADTIMKSLARPSSVTRVSLPIVFLEQQAGANKSAMKSPAREAEKKVVFGQGIIGDEPEEDSPRRRADTELTSDPMDSKEKEDSKQEIKKAKGNPLDNESIQERAGQ